MTNRLTTVDTVARARAAGFMPEHDDDDAGESFDRTDDLVLVFREDGTEAWVPADQAGG